ncbi:MAG: sulfotransferase [Leptolyngbya sp. SIO1E4]|nr:sulfotransferase [Leptolyngbya sp. SIO1E4]
MELIMDFLQQTQNIQQSYIVCSTGRSGSTLLCRTLAQSKLCGNPQEYFHHRTIKQLGLKGDLEKFKEYCHSILQEGTTSNGVFGIKMHWWQMSEFLKIAKKIPAFKEKSELEILNTFFPNPKFVYIWRQDMVAQAVSTTIALQTDVWEKRARDDSYEMTAKAVAPKDGGTKDIEFQPLKIYKWEENFKDQNKRWLAFLQENELNYHEVINESLVSDFENKMKAVIEFLEIDGIDENSLKAATKKQSTSTNRKFIQRYQQYPKLLLKVVSKIDRQLNKKSKKQA